MEINDEKTLRILGKRGRVTIPQEVRDAIGMTRGDVVSFAVVGDDCALVKFDEERLKALKKYLKRKANSTVEQELEYALTRLYEKAVPPTVREYLEEDNEDAEDTAPQE